jgi:uncharacterized membrane protein
MEVVLLVVLIIIFLITINSLTKKIDRLQVHFFEVNNRLDQLKKLLENSGAAPVLPKKPDVQPQQPAPAANVTTQPDVPVVRETPVAPIPVPQKPTEPKITEPLPRVAAFTPPAPAPQQRVPLPPKKSWWDNFKEQNPDLEKFIGENLINKIGILILVLGISYFVKFAIDKDWINEPARVGIGVLAGGLVMLVAHQLRVNYKAFSSVLVAGAISIFYFTITVAFHDYGLFSQTAAFIIMVAITGFSAFISVNYNRVELAALSLIGGFAAPFMVSTGSGNFVVLFTYIAILNIGILSIAYYKKWTFINAQAYIFTVLLFGTWLISIDGTKNAPYAGALLFAFIFYLIFIVMNIINNIRTKAAFSTMQLIILVSNTFLFYGAGMYAIDHFMPQYKGLFTLLLGVFNFCFAWLLYKKLAMDQKIIYILIGLTLTFVTLTIPIQFNGNYITLFWAAEAVLLLWLAQKSRIESFRLGSVVVHALMLISLLMDWAELYNGTFKLLPVVNSAFLTGLFAIASCIAVILLLKKDTGTYVAYGITFNIPLYSKILQIVSIALIYFTGFIELNYQAEYYLESTNAVYTLLVIYHFTLSIIFIHTYCIGKSLKMQKGGTVLAIINSVLFILLFSRLAYSEVEDYLNDTVRFKLAYWLHFAALAAAIYTIILTYKINKDAVIVSLKSKSVKPWIAAFLLIYLASSELMLHWLVVSLEPIKAKYVAGVYTDAYESIYIMRSQVIKTGYPILWGVIAFGLLLLGIKKQLKNIRIAALVLLGITIAKLFLYDIRNASETGKIIAFILLGVLILVISFVYQKLKLLVIADKPEETLNENKTDDEII